ncbi:PQQ-dependent sugar dehydrogenase [Planctomycetaceae bacterium]|nr:PQQ-dependent sugar dehydrogenase [Planctomycetaceae bacterium]
MLKLQLFTALVIALSSAVCGVAQDEDQFRSTVRPTDPLTPEEQRQTFRLPPGFQIQLVAAEPDILKPMNLAFDIHGRLWASMSQEYPYAAPADRQPQDCIKIFEDTTGDGKFDKIVTFADGLNIPIGLHPYKRGVIVWSIPNIWYLEDTNGDDKADKRTILYGPMGFERDTHGMNNGFTRGFDGWMYACHGFNNETSVAGADGHQIQMQSGNTYRIRTDGRRIEHFTHGQVNPFGMVQDSRGNLFTADCHSKPIYQLIEGGYYPSFGKPHDGLGHVPPMMEHLHGSTAISGVAIYEDDLFPQEFRGNMFSGNVMTSRINRNRLKYHGATVKAVEEPDFLSTSDPWFRPVDVQLGPDGALYVADFYNRIIGHYEVPLDHPGRDRTSGRIWRITYSASDHAGRLHSQKRVSKYALPELIQELGHPNQTRRMLIADYLSDTVGEAAISALYTAVENNSKPSIVAHAMWVLYRLKVTEQLDYQKLMKHPSPLVRLHTLKVIHEMLSPPPVAISSCEYLLNDEDSFVQLAATEVLGRHGVSSIALEELLLRKLEAIPLDDAILFHATRMSLRDLFSRDNDFAAHQTPSSATAQRSRLVAGIMLGMKTESAGIYLLDYLRVFPDEANRSPEFLEHIVNTLPENRIPDVVQLIRQQLDGQWGQQLPLLFSIRETLGKARSQKSSELMGWADDLFIDLTKVNTHIETGWSSVYAERDPWDLQSRPCADGKTVGLISSHPHGEQLTGTFRSPVFNAPSELRFYLCGHGGFPTKEAHHLNRVTLHDAENDKILKIVFPPRNDTAQQTVWNLEPLNGQKVYLRATDGDSGGAYAWLAFGRIEPDVISIPNFPPKYEAALLVNVARLQQGFQLDNKQSELKSFLRQAKDHPEAQHLLASAYLQQQQAPLLASLANGLQSPNLPAAVRTQIVEAILNDRDLTTKELSTFVKQLPSDVQQMLIVGLTNSVAGRECMFDMLTVGHLSSRLLQRQEIAAKLDAVASPEQKKTIAELTKNLPDVSAELKLLIAARLKEYPAKTVTAAAGRLIFEKNCQNCHQLTGKGALIGPQLNGIGNRGASRLFEDTLDPNQNVDVAFHSMTIVTTEGKVITGLFRRKEGDKWILADNKGKEIFLSAEEIEESNKSPLSLMPESIARDLPPDDFYSLMKFLLDQTGPPPKKQ